MNKKKDILFIAGVHGNEKIGIRALKKIDKKGINPKRFDWIAANTRALEKNRRFVDADLNRIAPGNAKSKIYEERLAAKILKKAKKYRCVIDIHGSKRNIGIFAIITNQKRKNMQLVSSLPCERVVVWPLEKGSQRGPLVNFVPCGAGIECGPRSSKKTEDKLVKFLESVIKNGCLKNNLKKEYFLVFGKLVETKSNGFLKKYLKEFKKAQVGGEEFYPLLIGRYKKTICYKMKKIVSKFN